MAMHDDVTAGEREDDGSRMEKFVDNECAL